MQSKANLENLLTVEQAAPLIGLRPATIYSKICRRTMPVSFIKLPSGDIRFKPSAIEAFLKTHTFKAQE